MKLKKRPILIVLIAGIGDIILSSRSIRAMRKGYPDVKIHLLTSPQAASIAQNYKYIDYVWSLPIREIKEDKFHLLKILQIIRRLREIDFGVIINLYRVCTWMGAFEMGLLFMLLKGKIKIGHGNKGFNLFLDKKAPEDLFKRKHIVDAMVDMASLAGGIPDDRGIEIFFKKKKNSKWESLIYQNDQYALNIAINPGGARHNRRWSPLYYAQVADKMSEIYKCKIFILGGPGEEAIAKAVTDNMKKEAVNLSGQLTINDLIYFISRMDILITNDSAPMHIAAATKTPVVAIFGPEDPRLFGPYTTLDLYRIVYKDLDCRPCKKKKCEKPICLENITPEEVIEKCTEILKNQYIDKLN
jgi:lipopolysaccharide heptosyltransferase II